jgi:hypothetical protein
MDPTHTGAYTKLSLELINACRMYLQVTTLAEISNDARDRILQQVLHNPLHMNGKPKLHDISQSLLQWPQQKRSSKHAWTLRKRFLQMHNNEQGYLTTPLGPWLSNCLTHCQWFYTSNGPKLLNRKTNPPTLNKLTPTRSRKTARYDKERMAWSNLPAPFWPITTIITNSEYNTITKQKSSIE